MLRRVDSLRGFSIGAKDGEIGKVVEFFFDDEKWTIRYLVADTGGWLGGRKVLISPMFFGSVNWDKHTFNVNLIREQVENSPSIDTDKPVSRQHESSYYDYYNFPYYWIGAGLWEPVTSPPGTATATAAAAPEAAALRQQSDSENIHLRSTKDIAGSYIETNDGDLGHVQDFIIDDENWTIRYLLIDTSNWWPGKKVLISPEWVNDMVEADSRVYVDLSQEQIKTSPAYDEATVLNRDYESRLYRHYGRSEYWTD
jgi:sporulation protein YlmC with PRC-barrel domain